MKKLLHEEISAKILSAFYDVYNELGFGFLERVYENAMMHELELLGLKCSTQVPIKVFYKEKEVGKYFADILVEDLIILELKSGPLRDEHEFQLLNYLKATEIELGFLLSFGKDAEFDRKIFHNKYK